MNTPVSFEIAKLLKEFIPYEQALELKEIEFDEPCFAAFYFDGRPTEPFSNYQDVKNSIITFGTIKCTRPTFSQAFRWFREKYGLPNWVYTSNNKEFWYSILKDGRMIVRDYSAFNSYEEAELACLRKLIEIVKQK